MPSLTVQSAVQDVKLAAEKLGAIDIPLQPHPMDFHNLAIRLREFARKADLLASLAIADASVNSTIEFTSETNFLHDQLDNEEVFSGLSQAADEADENNTPRRSLFTGRRVVERVL